MSRGARGRWWVDRDPCSRAEHCLGYSLLQVQSTIKQVILRDVCNETQNPSLGVGHEFGGLDKGKLEDGIIVISKCQL